MPSRTHLNNFAKLVLLAAASFGAISSSALDIPAYPLSVNINGVKPMVMLVAGKDHRFFYEAYNDAGDVDGDGTLDIRFKPSITYLGLYQSNLCYEYSTTLKRFQPKAQATSATDTKPYSCAGSSHWSGNWLNYVTTSRIDALRVVLYGGHRSTDTASLTVLRRAYIPQDSHSWAKEYTSTTVDKYNIKDYTPFDVPKSNTRHFFGSLTANASTNCSTLSNCSDTLSPLLRARTNVARHNAGTARSPSWHEPRVWHWASKERPVLADRLENPAGGGEITFPSGSDAQADYVVQVEVCTGNYTGGCKQYPNGNYKPFGLLHDYGESDVMLFGLLTGSYDKSMSGGRLRKVVSSFKSEIDENNGTFKTGASPIVTTFNNMRIRDFNNGRSDAIYRHGFTAATEAVSGRYPDWGNPIGEMLYEAVRYFGGTSNPTGAYAANSTDESTVDRAVGMPSVNSWDDPYSTTSSAKAPSCSRGNLLAISDINVSYDSDELPGAYSGFKSSGFTSTFATLNVEEVSGFITANEPDVSGFRYIGQSGTDYDTAPTAKNVTHLGQIRGLAPEEPTKKGSYYSAAVSYYAKKTDLRADLPGVQTLDTFVVALASPLPRIEAKLRNGKVITLVPFAKSVGGQNINNARGQFQPTNQIVDFYVQKIVNSGEQDRDPNDNDGNYHAIFRINYEDVEQGADHDMDAIVEYEVKADSQSRLTVKVTPKYEGGDIKHRIGYIISGTGDSTDGIYLDVQDESDSTPYFLNTPTETSKPGHCRNVTTTTGRNGAVTVSPSECARLPYIGGSSNSRTRTFTAATTKAAATLLKDPLWYAAKWGGFVDKNSNNKPDLDIEWDADGDGMPDTYLLVQNPLKLKESLKKSLDNIANRSSSASNISANSTSISSNARLYQAVFNTQSWSGDLVSYPTLATGGVGTTADWYASRELPAWNLRNIFMRTATGTTVKLGSYGALPEADRTALVSQDVFEYLRGNRSKELRNGGVLRDREHALGDIVHSSPYYDKDSGMVYVGANDGMLHAFNGRAKADDGGRELFAFIPRSSVSRLKNLAAQSYGTSVTPHQWYVDGDMNVMNTTNGTTKKSYLFAMLGRGGKGLFALDVTTPASFSAANFLWEYTPETAMTVGTLRSDTDPDLGLMLGRSVAVPLNNGKMGLLVGNGYNSTDQKAVLYVFVINANGSIASIRKLDTGVAGDNGLAAPVTADTNNDGTADVAYAGDLKGNVWKFDLSASDPNGWHVVNNAPLFVATDSANNRQPITAPMTTAVNDRADDPNLGKRFIFFGTGYYFKAGDGTDQQCQGWYGIIDSSTTVLKTELVARTMTSGTFAGTAVRTFSQAAPNDMANRKGWRIELPVAAPPVATGERIVTSSRLVPFVVPALMASSLYPNTTDVCVPGGNGYLNVIDPWNGASLSLSVLDVNNSGGFSDDTLNGVPIGSLDLSIGIPTEPLFLTGSGKVDIYVGGSGTTSTSGALIKYIAGLGKTGSVVRGRISWREIVRD